MATASIRLNKDGVGVNLNDVEIGVLKELQSQRDAALRRYDRDWQALFDTACERSGVLMPLKAEGQGAR